MTKAKLGKSYELDLSKLPLVSGGYFNATNESGGNDDPFDVTPNGGSPQYGLPPNMPIETPNAPPHL